MIRQKKKKTVKNIHVGADGLQSESYLQCMIGHQFSGQGKKKKNKQKSKHKRKQKKQKQNIPATLKAGGDDFRRC